LAKENDRHHGHEETGSRPGGGPAGGMNPMGMGGGPMGGGPGRGMMMTKANCNRAADTVQHSVNSLWTLSDRNCD
jgi:hypothetical protein